MDLIMNFSSFRAKQLTSEGVAAPLQFAWIFLARNDYLGYYIFSLDL